MKTVITCGVFDMLHWGHFELFRRAKELAGTDGRLIVAVQEDDIVVKYKPQTRLVYNWSIRTSMVRALRYVDEVVPYGDVDESIKHFDFDVFVVGGDQCHAGFQAAMKWCLDNDRQVVKLPRTELISTTELKDFLNVI